MSEVQLESNPRIVRPQQRRSFPKWWPVILGCCLLFTIIELTRPFIFEVQLEVSSSKASTAQLYFDRGTGYHEPDSVSAPVFASPPGHFQKLTFKLPETNIHSLRFDPLKEEGRVLIKNARVVAGYRAVVKFTPSQIVPLHQIRSITTQSNQVAVDMADRANDPQLSLVLSRRLRFWRLLVAQRAAVVIVGDLILLTVGWLLWRKTDVLYTLLRAAFSGLHRRLQAIAGQISLPGFIRFDAYALWFYLVCFAVFFCASLADLNGSSLGMYRVMFGQQPDTLLGTPKSVRADEWAYQTPIIMNQVLRADRFAVVHSAFGDHSAALIGCVPVKHVSTLFRPQFWAFFVLPLDYAYAVYWQMKALILLCGVFTWLLLATNSTFWSVTGTLWYFFSPFTQWAYSWASLLPESVGLICLAMVFSCFLTVGRNRIALALSALGLATCAIDFALCAYLPHLIPLFWLAIFFFIGWCIANRASVLRSEDRFQRLAAVAGALLITGVIGMLVYVDVKDTIIGISNTIYPGKRHFSGANTFPVLLLSHFLDWTANEQHVPASLANISEAAGFLWLAPVTIFFAARLDLSRQKRAALLSLWCIFLLLLSWMLLPVPAMIGKVFALDRTGSTRCLPALGLANIAIVCICSTACIRSSPSGSSAIRNRRLTSENVLQAAGIFSLMLIILWQTNLSLGKFYGTGELLLATALATLFILLMLHGLTKALAFALVISQAAAFSLVNPIERGLTPITDTAAFSFFQSHRELLRHKWIFFAEGVMAPGFLEALGCDEYTGIHFLPDIDHFPLFKARGFDVRSINNSGDFLAHAIDSRSRSYIKEIQTGIAEWYVSPTDPLLKQLGIEYAAFETRPSPSIEAGLIPVHDGPVGTIWLYRLP